MKRVIPFIQTLGSEKYKDFLATPFTVDMLYPVFNEKSCETLFDGWRGKNMVNWHKFTNDNKIILEFYPTYYTVTKNVPNAVKYMLSIPKTINEFVNDMDRFGVELFWTTCIDEKLEPKEYMQPEEIKNYFADLLGKLGKSHELL